MTPYHTCPPHPPKREVRGISRDHDPRIHRFRAHVLLSLSLWGAGCLSLNDEDNVPSTPDSLPSENGPPPSTGFPPATLPGEAGPPPVEEEEETSTEDSPRIVSFGATPERITFLATATLSWRSENTDSCRISPDVGAVPVEGSVTVASGTPGSQRIFVLQCEKAGTSTRAETTVETRSVVHTGDLLVRNAAELASLTGVNVVTGNVTILQASGVFDVDAWESLVEVQGSLSFRESGGLASIQLPYLERIGDDLNIDDLPSLSTLSLPRLARIGDRLYASRTPALPAVHVQGLVQQLESRDGIGGAILTYQNSPSAILAAMEQGFSCTSSDTGQPYYLLLFNGNAAGGELYLENGLDPSASATGVYTVQGDAIVIQLPGATSETTSALEFEYDHAISFSSPSFSLCHSIESGLDDGVSQEHELVCPEIQYALGSGTEQNRFWIRPHGQVEWEQIVRLAEQGNEAQRVVRQGIYVFNGIWMHLAFGNNLNGHRFMSGTLSYDNSRLLLDELAPELGPCTPPG